MAATAVAVTDTRPVPAADERERIAVLVRAAFTRAEIETAEATLSAWDAAHPDAPSYLLDLGHGLPRQRDYLLLREEQAEQMGLSPAGHDRREETLRLARDVAASRSLPDHEAAVAGLRAWLAAHPNDPLAPRVLETLEQEARLARDLEAALSEATPVDAPPLNSAPPQRERSSGPRDAGGRAAQLGVRLDHVSRSEIRRQVMAKASGSERVRPEATQASESESKTRKTRVTQANVPRHSLYEALRVPRAICDNYAKAPTKPLNVAAALELTPNSGHFKMLVGASTAYGLTEGWHSSDFISLTDLGRRIVAPTADDMEQAAMREALLRPRIIREFLTKYNNSKIPPDKIAKNVLEELGVPADSSEQTLQLILKGSKEVGLLREVKGNWYADLDGVSTSVNPEVNEDDEEAADDVPTAIPNVGQSGARSQDNVVSLIPSPVNNRVFITHGKNVEIVNQLKELLSFGNFTPVVAAEHETISKPVPDKVMDDMRSCYAAIIHVGREIKLLDQEGNEHFFLNQNVLIEIGAAMALYVRRFILLVERGATLPSNLQGLYEVRYEGDKLDYDATMKLLKAFNDFKS